ncbi:DUF4251 domain-containing protein [Ginsengibacter hankyongi]|uniref:DUF4251 domain-containing protein n=1 Tax=Ginsengibacter hankyongi TaxID=2607284 RepID=A0A5J5IC41_9BACT|nr:DUF4251 domain-containing protein [Ginsengibacter hankyongi]KAA9034511.1 DUF4251 domain-containing protein [Ginsengibacter hankyongi]
MTRIKYSRFILIIFLFLFPFPKFGIAQQNKKNDSKKTAIKNMIDSQKFIFEAQSVTPLRGNFRNLTSSYDVTVSKDTMRSYLPYFGRAFNPPYNQTKSPLEFTSTKFSYSFSAHKKNAWNIIIKPKDNSEIQQYLFTVFDNGRASLNVTSISRDPISFNGFVREKQ